MPSRNNGDIIVERDDDRRMSRRNNGDRMVERDGDRMVERDDDRMVERDDNTNNRVKLLFTVLIIIGLIIALVLLSQKYYICDNNYKLCTKKQCINSGGKIINKLNVGDVLYTGDAIFSPDNSYKAILEDNGDFIIYKVSDNSVIWKMSKTPSIFAEPLTTEPSYIIMQSDGNLVVRKLSNGRAVWSSKTDGTTSKFVTLDKNGVLSTGDDSKIYWYSRPQAT